MAISVHELTEYISWASDDYLHLALSDGTDGKITKANIISGLATPGALDVYYVKRSNNLSDIANPELARANLNLGSIALLNEITKSDIVDFNEADYATAAQGALANSALQPGDNISELVNDAGYILTSQKGVANGVASLDSNGKIPEIQIPAIAISNTFVVDSELEMLALDAQVGDVAIRNDESKSYILQGPDASNLSDWQDLKTPAGEVSSVNGQTGTVILDADDIDDSVTTNKFVTSAQITKLAGIEAGAQVNTVDSVNGQTGTVVLVKADVGLSDVDNTSDLAKPISTATQTALNAKQDTITGAATTITGSNLTANRAVISNGSGKVAVSTVTSTELGYVSGVTSAIQTQLNDKATSAQGELADTAVQPGANITVLTNDAGYITSADAPVQSVNGLTGTVVLTKASVGLGNVDDTSDLAKPISTATQTALDGKQATITGAATTITGSNLTASRALVSDASGKVAVSSVMSSEVAHLSGVTAGIQGQINAKANSSVNLVAGTGLTGGGDLTEDRSFAVTYGTTAGTAAQGNDTRLSDAREWTASTVSQVEAEAGTATTRRAWTAQRVRQAITAWWNTVGTTVGRAIFTLTNPSAIRFLRINADNTVTARTAAEMQTDLGLGTAATATLTTSTSDTTIGRVLKVGDFGIGPPLTLETNVDLNTKVEYGDFMISSSGVSNNPSGTGAGYLSVRLFITSGINRIFQTYTCYGNPTYGRVFKRIRLDATTWTDWVEEYNTFNVTGAVTSVMASNLTASRALVSDGSGKIEASSVTNTEIGYLSGVTSGIQTQLNEKASTDVATTSVNGLMSSSDKTKLDGIATGAEVNQNTFTTISVAGQGDVVADTKTDTLTLVGGTGVNISTDPTTDTITFEATGIGTGTIEEVLAGNGLTGGGTSSTVTLNVGSGTGITVGADTVGLDTANTRNVDHSAVSITAGTGLTGGGDLTATRTLNVSYGTTAGTAAQGNDSRLSDSREWTATTVDQTEAETGTATTRRAWTAQRVRQAIVAWWNTVGTTVGKALLNLTNPSATRFLRINADNTVTARSDSEMRTDLGLGTAATATLTTSTSDTTVGRVLTVGYMGLGSTNFGSGGDPLVILDNLAVVRPTGFYRYSSIATNKPTSENGYLIYITRSTSTIGIRATTDSGRVFNCNWDGVATTLTWVECYTASTTVPISSGGTDANNAADARTNLGLGTVATQTVVTGNGDTTTTRIPTVGWVQANANNYTLPAATATILGGIELFSNTVQSVTANAVSSTAARTYGIQVNSDGQAVVNVPWTDSDTTYSGSTSITLSGNSFQRAALTGDVSASSNSNTTTIANNVVTNTKLADMGADTIKGRVTSAGDPQDLTATQVRTIINVENGATANQTDSYLLSRANHTGTQAHTTITGLGTAATADVTTSTVDLTTGRALTTGYGGLLSENITWADTLYGSGRATDLNSRFKNALSGVVDAPNQPFGSTGVLAGHLTLPLTSGGRGLQFYFSPNTHTNRLAFRTYNSPTFQPWVDILHTGSTIPNTQITGLGTAATLNTGTTTGTVATGDHTHANATTSVPGFMSEVDKTKLDGVATGAEVNQNTFATIAVPGQSSVVADSKTDTLTIAAGSGIAIATNAATGTVIFSATGSGTVTEVVAGGGLTGGGTSSTVTLNVGAGDGISVAADTVAVDSTVVRTTGTQSIGGAKTFTSEVTAPSFNTTSSLKYKKDVMPFENALEKLMAIDVITYKRKIPEGEPQDDKTYLGVSAESLAKVVPELVNFKDGEADSVNYAQGFALCVQAIQELVKNRGD